MTVRTISIFWILVLFGAMYLAHDRGDGSSYLYTILGGAIIFWLVNLVWPDWVEEMPTRWVPLAFAVLIGFVTLGMTWTLLTDEIETVTKIVTYTFVGAMLAYGYIKDKIRG